MEIWATKAEIQDLLNQWLAADQQVRAAEAAALQAMGLGRYADFGALMRDLLTGGAPNDPRAEELRKQLGSARQAVVDYCRMRAAFANHITLGSGAPHVRG